MIYNMLEKLQLSCNMHYAIYVFIFELADRAAYRLPLSSSSCRRQVGPLGQEPFEKQLTPLGGGFGAAKDK